ncbi:SH3 domain-binding protein 5 [Collichthys lucidus]|uniref:SH3 domain-binding protein 5 n=1 Tax=Collichthys lucidus TaxID=240159 RepID=A0A4U5V4Z9_COLLU|nr:SH3 domain-binding protein 5 [Collichthys lucidus]
MSALCVASLSPSLFSCSMDHLEKEHRSDDETEYEDEEVDPRIQDARQKFRSVLVEATVKLDELVKKIGKAVEESKPYWEARRLARQGTLLTELPLPAFLSRSDV